MRLVNLAHGHRWVAAALVVTTCLMPIGLALAQTQGRTETEELEEAWRTGDVMHQVCAEAAAARDAAVLDDIAYRMKKARTNQEDRLRQEENDLNILTAGLQRARDKYRNLQVQKVKAEEEIERAHDNGQPKTITDVLRTRLANVQKDLASERTGLMEVEENTRKQAGVVRARRGQLGLARVLTRTVELCIEKRRAELGPPIVASPAKPVGPLAQSFSLAGTWGGACGSIAVGGTFTVRVAQGGVVNGRYIRSGSGDSGTLSGTLGSDGKLAAGSGRESDFSVRWVGNVVPGAAGPSGTGTWNGSAGTLKCGGSWKSTGQPA